MLQVHPNFDIQIGDVLFSEKYITVTGSTKPMTLLDLVQKIVINKNLDKSATKGKKRVKTNTCDVVISNPQGQLNNILRFGRKVTVWLGHGGDGDPLVGVGTYTLYRPKWIYPRNGMPSVHFQAKAGDMALWYEEAPRTEHNITHSQFVAKLAKEAALLADIEPTHEKLTLIKSFNETDHDAIARWAYDCGMDFYIDTNTTPNTLVWKRVSYRPMTDRSGKELSIGWGPGNPATLQAAEMTIERNYPEPSAFTGQLRDKAGGVNTLGSDPFKYVPIFYKAQDPAYGENTVFSTGTSGMNFNKKIQAGAAAARLARQVDCLFDPGIPFFELGRTIPVVGMGDHDRVYKLLDITHEVTWAGYTTRVKLGIMAGSGKNGKKDDPRIGANTMGSNPRAYVPVHARAGNSKPGTDNG